MKLRERKSKYIKNRFSKDVFFYLMIIALVGFTLVYEEYFITFSINGVWDHLKLYFMVAVVGTVSYYLTFRFHRNIISIIGIGVIPVLFYDLVNIWRYEDTIKFADMIGAVLVVCVSAGLAGIYCRKLRRSNSKKKFFYENTAFLTRIGVCAIMIVSVFIGKKHINEQYTLFYSQIFYNISDSQDDIWDYDNSLAANIEEISKLDPECGWRDLTLDDKAAVLEQCIRVETRYYGIDQAPALRISHLEENLLGEYNQEANEITLSYEYLTVADGYSILRVVTHEMAHAYQHCLVELFQDIKGSEETKKYENLRLLYTAGQYEEELSHYVSDVTDDISYIRYATQLVEVDAEKMADQSLMEFYEEIQNYLKSDLSAA